MYITAKGFETQKVSKYKTSTTTTDQVLADAAE